MNSNEFSDSTVEQQFEVILIRSGVIYATSMKTWMTFPIARPMCASINNLSRKSGAKGLVMNLSSLSKATPRAGFYAFRQMKQFPIERIALLGGGLFMRSFAKTVLTLGRFPSFKFFKNEADAISWVEQINSKPPSKSNISN